MDKIILFYKKFWSLYYGGLPIKDIIKIILYDLKNG